MVDVRIKPLEWGKTSYGSPEAFTVAGVYRINEAMNGGWTVVAGKRVLRDTDGRTNFSTIEAAKAAAQADYESLIRSTLSDAVAEREAEPVAWQRRIKYPTNRVLFRRG